MSKNTLLPALSKVFVNSAKFQLMVHINRQKVVCNIECVRRSFLNTKSLDSMSSPMTPDTPLSPPPEPYQIRLVTKDDTEKILEHLRHFFFRDEPLNINVKLLENRDTCPELEKYSVKAVKDDMSLLAITDSGKVIGVSLNGIIKKDAEPDTTVIKDSKFSKIVTLLEHIDNEVDIFGRYPDIDKQLVVSVLSVDSTWRGQGIAKKLMNKSRDLAREHGFKFMRADCSSYISAKALARLGFECIYRLKYEDYKVDGIPVFNPEPPHTQVSIYAQIIS